MAVYPCDIGSHRYGGAQKSAYLTDCSNSRPDTVKLRLCPRHFEHVEEVCELHMEKLDESTDSQLSTVCTDPGCVTVREKILFVKLFPGGEDYVQYAGDFCAAHGASLWADLGWHNAKPL